MKALLQHLVDHMGWANGRTLQALRDTPGEDARRLFAHVLTAEQIYLARMSGSDPWPQQFWVALSLEQCRVLLEQNHQQYRAFLAARSEEELGQKVRYRNSRGEPYETPVVEMLLHVALHGEHHRGQIARAVRAAGGTPAVTDYITYTRA